MEKLLLTQSVTKHISCHMVAQVKRFVSAKKFSIMLTSWIVKQYLIFLFSFVPILQHQVVLSKYFGQTLKQNSTIPIISNANRRPFSLSLYSQRKVEYIYNENLLVQRIKTTHPLFAVTTYSIYDKVKDLPNIKLISTRAHLYLVQLH